MSKWLSGILTLMVFSALVSSFLFLTPTLSLAVQVKMKWDANKPAPTGYRIFQRTLGQAYDYKKPVWQGSATTATIGSLKDKTKYFFVVRAYKGDKESGDSNEIAFSSSPGSPGTTVAAEPTVTPDGGKFSGSVKVSLKSTTPGAKIYYTTNGKTPTKRSTRYKKPFTLKKNTTVKAFAVAAGYKNSPMARATFRRTSGAKKAAAVLTPTTSDVTAAKVQQRPYGGKPWPIPGTIEAEDFDTGGEAAAYHDTTESNRGGEYRKDAVDIWYADDRYSGYYTGANDTGEWLEYTVKVAAGGMYSLDLNVATPKDNRKMHVMLDGEDLTGPIRLPNTGGWHAWETVMTTVKLEAGKHVLRVMFDRGGLNFNWIDIHPIGP